MLTEKSRRIVRYISHVSVNGKVNIIILPPLRRRLAAKNSSKYLICSRIYVIKWIAWRFIASFSLVRTYFSYLPFGALIVEHPIYSGESYIFYRYWILDYVSVKISNMTNTSSWKYLQIHIDTVKTIFIL